MTPHLLDGVLLAALAHGEADAERLRLRFAGSLAERVEARARDLAALDRPARQAEVKRYASRLRDLPPSIEGPAHALGLLAKRATGARRRALIGRARGAAYREGFTPSAALLRTLGRLARRSAAADLDEALSAQSEDRRAPNPDKTRPPDRPRPPSEGIERARQLDALSAALAAEHGLPPGSESGVRSQLEAGAALGDGSLSGLRAIGEELHSVTLRVDDGGGDQ